MNELDTSARPACNSLSINEKHHILYHIHNINNDDGAEERSHICFIKLYDDDFVVDRDDTIPIIHEMDDNYHSESDNFDMPRLGLKANLRLVSTACPLDMTLTQLLRNKPITYELMANPLTLLAAPEPSPSAPGLLSFVTKREEV